MLKHVGNFSQQSRGGFVGILKRIVLEYGGSTEFFCLCQYKSPVQKYHK